jgi:predicted RNase H-like HicB family nuclease
MEVRVQFMAKLPIKIDKERKWYTASCPILDVYSQGETETKAKKNLKEALSLFFISCFERGTLDAVLKQCGFKAAQPIIKPKKSNFFNKQDYINIPIPFLVNQNPQLECHV